VLTSVPVLIHEEKLDRSKWNLISAYLDCVFAGSRRRKDRSSLCTDNHIMTDLPSISQGFDIVHLAPDAVRLRAIYCGAISAKPPEISLSPHPKSVFFEIVPTRSQVLKSLEKTKYLLRSFCSDSGAISLSNQALECFF